MKEIGEKMKNRSMISTLAKEAKTRMKMYTQSVGTNNPYKMGMMSKSDCNLYEKVCKILTRDSITTNPINELIDREYYDTLPADAKQRYILYLSEKYLALKARFYQERATRVS